MGVPATRQRENDGTIWNPGFELAKGLRQKLLATALAATAGLVVLIAFDLERRVPTLRNLLCVFISITVSASIATAFVKETFHEQGLEQGGGDETLENELPAKEGKPQSLFSEAVVNLESWEYVTEKEPREK